MFGREKYRLLRRFFLRPILPFALDFLILAPLVLWHDRSGLSSVYLVVAPWLLVALMALNLPLFQAAFGAARLDLPTRRNHALEHATIYFIRTTQRVAGKAERDGFRVSGGVTPDTIRVAFDQVARVVRDRAALPHISRHCGSNRVTALALGISTLVLVTVVSILVRPPTTARVAALLLTVGVFLAMRHRVGNWVQRRLFMSTDFAEVGLRGIRKVTARPTETPPVYFVETRLA